MNKSIAREIIIGLLLCLAILLILSVLLYSYIPNNKVVPEPVAYSTPEDAKGILAEVKVDTSKVILTHEFNGNDLSTAQKTNSYNPGKVNPFSSYKPEEENEGNATGGTSTGASTAGTSTNSGSTNNGTTNNGTSSANNTDSSTGSTSNSSNTNGTNSSQNSSSSSSTSGGTYYKDKGTK